MADDLTDRAPARPRRRALLAQGLRAPLTALQRTRRDRAVARVQLASAAVLTASWAAVVALTVVAWSAGGSGAVALSVAARSLPGALAGSLVGAVVDRFPRRRTLLAAALVAAAACAGAAAAASSAVAVCACVAVVALMTTLFRAGVAALLPELVSSPEDLTSANVLGSAVEALGVFAGPALAGALLSLQGPATAFAVAAGLLAVAAALLTGPPGARPAPPEGSAAISGWGGLARLPAVRLLLSLALAQTLVGGGLSVLYAGLSVEDLRAGEAGVGLLTSAFGLGGVLGSVGLFALAGSRRLGAWMAGAVLLWSVPLLAVPLTPSLPVALLLLAVVGGGNVLFDVTIISLVQRAVPDHLLGRAFVAVYTVATLGMLGGAGLAPALDAGLGPSGAVAALAAPLLVAGLVALRPLQRLDVTLAAPVHEVALLRALAPFALLPAPALERLALRLQRAPVAAGATVVRQGEQGRHWYLVDTGRLAVSVDGEPVGDLGPGEAFGEIALLRAGVRTATVTAREPSVLWALSGRDFLGALHGGGARAAAEDVAESRLRHAAPVTLPEQGRPGRDRQPSA